MVAHRSPKPPVRVRVLLPLPKKLMILSLAFFIFIKEFLMYKKFINLFFIFLIILIILTCICYNASTENKISSTLTFHYNSSSLFSWPLFGYYTISSKFGSRISPITGASSYHSGIDIPAPPRNKYIFNL